MIEIGGPVADPFTLTPADLDGLPRHEVWAGFHCVAGWSATDLRWGGVRFADVHRELMATRIRPGHEPTYVVATGYDGWRATALLADLLADDVLLADELDGRPLDDDHGAPVRLVSPAQYGFVSVKHLRRLDLHVEDPGWPPRMRVLSPHPRARVDHEERRRDLPGPVVRPIYRALLPVFMRLAGAGKEGRRAGAAELKDSGPASWPLSQPSPDDGPDGSQSA